MPDRRRTYDYRIEYCNGRPRSYFPVGAPLLAIPMVAVASLINPEFNDGLRHRGYAGFEKAIASFYGALAGVLYFWLILVRFRTLGIALAATIIFCLCTSMWSTATRALWQHGPMVLMIVTAMLLLLRAGRHPAIVQYAAIPLAMAFVIRPTAAIPIVVLGVYVLASHRAWLARFVCWAAMVGVPWVAFNVHACGAPLPTYYLPERLSGSSTFWEAMAGNLISPARGLFFFAVLLFALSGFVLSLREREERTLHVAYAVIVILHWIAISRFPHWWGGVSFGPRFMTDVLPFLAYFVAFNFRLRVAAGSWKQAAVSACIGVLAVASMLIHASGAIQSGPMDWNGTPTPIDKDPKRVWDWHDLSSCGGGFRRPRPVNDRRSCCGGTMKALIVIERPAVIRQLP
jgi:hypothetical protein